MVTRRTALAGFGALGAGFVSPGWLSASTRSSTSSSPEHVRPPRLRPGDTVGLIQPAGIYGDAARLHEVAEGVRRRGLVPKMGAHITARYGYLAGTDAERAADVNTMFADKSVRAIFAVRGGWGCARLLPLLDFKTIRANPKLLVGFSDITALHLAIAARAGFTTIHGPNAAGLGDDFSWAQLKALAFDGAQPLVANPRAALDGVAAAAPDEQIRTIRGGKATGRLLGGNLTVLSSLVGSSYLPDFSGAILFIEDVQEAPYRIDRMLTQLSLAGILSGVRGVVFGRCTKCEDKEAGEGAFSVAQVLDQHLGRLGIPAFQGALFGHIDRQFSIAVGTRAEMDADKGTIRLLEPAIS